MKKYEMDALRELVKIWKNSTMLLAAKPLSDLLDSFDVEDSPTEIEQAWDKWLSSAPDSLTEYSDSLCKVCPECKGSGKQAYECDMGHYGGEITCSTCNGTGKKNDKN